MPPDEEAKLAKKDKGSGSPDRMLVPTFAETLKDATGGKSKIVAISLKDRSSVLPGGRKADACYWFDDRIGQFVTSTFYRERPHPWVTEFNETHPADRWFGKQWTKLRKDIDYARFSGPETSLRKGPASRKSRAEFFRTR